MIFWQASTTRFCELLEHASSSRGKQCSTRSVNTWLWKTQSLKLRKRRTALMKNKINADILSTNSRTGSRIRVQTRANAVAC
uniref:Uncharacterized protein n=1 Tax=Hyaloperonospora arabidopsidis (strain Emoy2) TaxID=559515 RepID=M4BU21_HYAAE